ncbi:nucleotidyl transferase AbiEii/AbiGii toxin family protein [Candidatus Woesearchaeota archaeon]|nr:nucleotidyl transferase AbiEii/AbiGii toxin family protein [Candidatus Woesearchaeota archaeon]
MKELITHLKSKLNIDKTRFLEKDIILHRILVRLMKTNFKKEYAFKGGTCLTKCHLGYYRFSEDMDFTYIKQEELVGKSQNQIRKILSNKINEVMDLLVEISKELNLDFKLEKGNAKYVMLGGSNKFTTFKMWYKNQDGADDFIKLQINYFETIINKIIVTKAKSLYSSINKGELQLLFPEYSDILEEVELQAYPLEEIFLEKIRAILTRRGTKSRDYIDVYLLIKKLHLDYEAVELDVIKKTEFMLVYDKYLENLSVIKPEKLVLGEEENLLLEPLEKDFKDFLPKFFKYLVKLEEKLRATQE